MTPLLDILHKVQEGVNKLPPLTEYPGTSCDILNSIILFKWNSHENEHEHLYKYAKDIVVYGVQLMQLADANMENEKLFNSLPRLVVHERHNEDLKRMEESAIEELTHHIGKQPIAMFRIRNRKPVFTYAERREQTKPNPQESDYLSDVIDTVNELAKINDLRMIRR